MSKYVALTAFTLLIANVGMGAQELAAEQPALVAAPAEVRGFAEDAAMVADDEAVSFEDQPTAADTLDDVSLHAMELVSDVAGFAETLDQGITVQPASAGMLKPIYQLAESLAFPPFYWLAFALLAAGTISYALQLARGKVVLLANGFVNVKEILSDTVGLVICLIGLVLTTQAATENSTFAESPSAVVSATVAGGLLGLCLYRWGQAEEVEVASGPKQQQIS